MKGNKRNNKKLIIIGSIVVAVIIFIVSNNANGNYPEYNALDSVISQKEWLTIQTINNKTFIRSIKYYNNIQINENEETTLSYDFGFTKW